MIIKLPDQIIFDSQLYQLYLTYRNTVDSGDPKFEWTASYLNGGRTLVSMKGKTFSDIEKSMLAYINYNNIESE